LLNVFMFFDNPIFKKILEDQIDRYNYYKMQSMIRDFKN